MDPLKNAKAESGRINKKIRTDDDSSSEDSQNDLQVTLGNKLSEDDLTLIFSSYWIFTQDLLNFRLVNKRWRDAATTILCRRSACYVTLIPRKHTDDSDSDDNSGLYMFRQYSDKKEPMSTLSQLTELITNSPNFPVTNFRIDTRLLHDLTGDTDLIRFFKLHGDKIKTCTLLGFVLQENVWDICFTHAPKLECLDLSWATDYPDSEERTVALKLPSKIFSCKSVIFSQERRRPSSTKVHYQELTHLLLSIPSKLSSIGVTPSSLAHVLENGKGHLVSRFYFHHERLDTTLLLVKKYLELPTSPRLSKLFLSLCKCHSNQMMSTPIIALIKSCRETVQDLTLQYPLTVLAGETVTLNIPPMKNLKTLTLSVSSTDHHLELGLAQYEVPYFVFAFEDGIPGHNYFPSLLSVKIKPQGCTFSLDWFYYSSFFHHLPENTLPNVDILEIGDIMWEKPKSFKFTFALFPSTIFPNLRVLKLCCGKISCLTSSLWKLRSLEFIEIYHISRNQKTLHDVALVPFVDQLFTGFNLDMCHKFQTKRLPRDMDTPKALKFLRMRPSICDLQNLKELKLKFSPYFSVQFASHLTGVYAFSKMLHTKFIISYDPQKINSSTAVDDYPYDDDDGVTSYNFLPEWNFGGENDSDGSGKSLSEEKSNDIYENEDEDIEVFGAAGEKDGKEKHYEELCFGPIKRYVKIVHEK